MLSIEYKVFPDPADADAAAARDTVALITEFRETMGFLPAGEVQRKTLEGVRAIYRAATTTDNFPALLRRLGLPVMPLKSVRTATFAEWQRNGKITH